MLAIKTENLTKKYKDKVAVNSINLSINKGEIYGLLGVNGAGKSTTIKMLSCLIKPTSGDAVLNGYSIVNDSEDVKKIINVHLFLLLFSSNPKPGQVCRPHR